MKTNRFLLSMISLIMICFIFFVSCDMGMEIQEEVIELEDTPEEEKKLETFDMDGGEGEMSISVVMPWDGGKSLSSNHDNTYSQFQLRTKYLSQKREGATVTGEHDPLYISAGTDGSRNSVNLGFFTQGKWRFDIEAVNKSGDILYVGAWEGYVSASAKNSIVISMEENSSDIGYICFDMVSVTIPSPRVVISYTKIFNGDGEHVLLDTASDPKGMKVETYPDGYSSYRIVHDEKEKNGIIMPAGAYMLKVQLWAGETLFSGEILDTYIIPKKATKISGQFTITGLENFISVAPDQTIKFTEACGDIELATGKMISGFHVLGDTAVLEFPYTNTTKDTKYLIPRIENVSKYFSVVNGVLSGKGYPYKQAGFNHEYPDSPREIPSGVFNGTSGARNTIEAVYAPSVMTIGKDAFAYSNIKDAMFGTLDSVGAGAFRGSSIPNLESTQFSSSVMIGDGAFESSDIEYMDFPTTARVGSAVFRNAAKLARVTFSTKAIPADTFNGCTSLKSVIFGDTETIGDRAFKGCKSLDSITLSEHLTAIGKEAFDGCSGLVKTLSIPKAVKTIGENAFRGTTSLSEIYLNNICPHPLPKKELGVVMPAMDILEGQPWGAKCDITWWGYLMYFNSNLEVTDFVKPEGYNEFPVITEQNGHLLDMPIEDPRVRVIAYNDVIGKTLDGYAIPIPSIDGWGFNGWHTASTGGDEITQLTKNKSRENINVYAHWAEGLVTVVFSPGAGPDDNSNEDDGVCDEFYRMVRYKGIYGMIADEDLRDDVEYSYSGKDPVKLAKAPKAILPVASMPGRDFLGWYAEREPDLHLSNTDVANGTPDETAQAALTKITNDTRITNKRSHSVYAHYRDHRYKVTFDPNLPTNFAEHGTRNGKQLSSYNTPASYTVVYGRPYSCSWDTNRLSSPSYQGTNKPLPNLNDKVYALDNYIFKGWFLDPECTKEVTDDTKVAAQSTNGANITLYAKWIGKPSYVDFIVKYTNPGESEYRQSVEKKTYRFSAPLPVKTKENKYSRFYDTTVLEAENESSDLGKQPFPQPSRIGYNFKYWSINGGVKLVDGIVTPGTPSEVIEPYVDPNNPLEAYAEWTPINYEITYDANGGSFTDGLTVKKTLPYHSHYILPDKEPTRPGYVFTGWYSTQSRTAGCGYQKDKDGVRNESWITGDSIITTSQNHRIYAGWSEVAVINDDNQASFTDTVYINPTGNGLGYGEKDNITFIDYSCSTILAKSTIGVYADGIWSDAPDKRVYVGGHNVKVNIKKPEKPETSDGTVVSEPDEIRLSMTDFNDHSKIETETANSFVYTSGTEGQSKGFFTIRIWTTPDAKPGTTSIVIIPSANGSVTGYAEEKGHGTLNVERTGRLKEINLHWTGPVDGDRPSLYVRNSGKAYAELIPLEVNGNRNLHKTQIDLAWTLSDTGDPFSEYCGTEEGDKWIKFSEQKGDSGHKLVTIAVNGKATVNLKAGYDTTKQIEVWAKNPTSGVVSTQKLVVKQTKPDELIMVPDKDKVRPFFDNMDTLRSKSDTAKKQWLITDFREWEGGNPLVPDNTGITIREENYVNNAGHPIYLYPVVVKTFTGLSRYPKPNDIGAIDSKDNVWKADTQKIKDLPTSKATKIAFPDNIIQIGGRDNIGKGIPSGEDREFGSVLLIYIGGSVEVNSCAFVNSNSVSYKISETGAITKVGDYGFYDNQNSRGLERSDFEKMKEIGEGAFMFYAKNVGFDANLNACTKLGVKAFAGSGLTALTTPITSEKAFAQCYSLTQMSFSGQTIEAGAFAQCYSLSIASISQTRTIKASAFTQCTNLGADTNYPFRWPNTLQTIEAGANYKSPISDGNYIDATYGAFEHSGLKGNQDLSNTSLSTLGTYAFYNCNNMNGRVDLPTSLHTIGGGAFRFTSITFVDLLDISTVSWDAFRGVETLTSADFRNVRYIGTYAFEGTGFSDVVLTSCTVDQYAFSGAKFTSGINCSSCDIKSYAFNGCPTLPSAWIYSSTINSYAFTGSPKMTYLYVNGGTVGSYAGSGASALNTVKFGGAAVTVQNYAFYNCGALSTVDVLDLGSDFKNSSHFNLGSGVWDGCNIQYIKITKNNFVNAVDSQSEVTNSRTMIAPAGVSVSGWGGGHAYSVFNYWTYKSHGAAYSWNRSSGAWNEIGGYDTSVQSYCAWVTDSGSWSGESYKHYGSSRCPLVKASCWITKGGTDEACAISITAHSYGWFADWEWNSYVADDYHFTCCDTEAHAKSYPSNMNAYCYPGYLNYWYAI